MVKNFIYSLLQIHLSTLLSQYFNNVFIFISKNKWVAHLCIGNEVQLVTNQSGTWTMVD